MRSVQFTLGLAVPDRPLSQEEKAVRRKHKLIVGRPRRLPPDSAVIKVAIPENTAARIDRIRERMHATRPEAIRTAVEMFVAKHGDGLGVSAPPPRKSNSVKPQRCVYWKIPFPPLVRAQIESLAIACGKRRQAIILLAIDEMLASYV